MEEKLSEITSESVNTNTTYRRQHIQCLLKERVKRIKEIVNKRLNLDLHYIEKANISFNDYIYQEIYKRVLNTIESEIEFAKNKMLHFCRNSPYPKDILKIMNGILDNEKNNLIENAKRDIKIHQKRFGLKIIGSELSKEQERVYETYGYNCKDRIYIPGTSSFYRSNGIIVNRNKIGDSLFLLLLRLAVELKKGEGGWVNIYSLYDEHIITDPDKYQIYSRLRTDLQGSLIDKDGKKFIENDGSKYYRISTHPDFITYNKEKLLNHKDPDIKKLAEELP